MGSHPLNLTLRFLLEMTALCGVGAWGWVRFDGVTGALAAFLAPLAFAVLWGVFAVPDDPSRGGTPVVAVPGWLRLALELALFTAAVVALWDGGWPMASFTLSALVLLHYGTSWDRIFWLLSR